MNIPADVKTGLYAFFVFVVGCIVAFLLWIAFGTETPETTVIFMGHGFAPHGRSNDHWVPHKGTTAVRGPQFTLRTNPATGKMYTVPQPNGHRVPHTVTTAVRRRQVTLRTNPVTGEMYNVAQPNGKQTHRFVLIESNSRLGGGAASEVRLSPLAGNPGMYEGSNGGTYARVPLVRGSSRRSKGNPRNRSNKRDTRT